MVYFSKCYMDCSLRPVFTLLVQAGIPCMWTNDSQRILLEHFDAILNSPSYIYYPALTFSPSSSWLHECYTAELIQVAEVVKGLQAEWEMCSRSVLLNNCPWILSYWNNTIAVGSTDKDIVILDAITGSQTVILPGHTDGVRSLTFSSDGRLLVSGSDDKTVKLWDMQTGGVIKTFHGYTSRVRSVSISADYTTIASGSEDKTFRLWNIEMGECHCIIGQPEAVYCTRFSPTDPQCLISVSGRIVQQWDSNGHKIGPTYNGHCIVFCPDGTQFASRIKNDLTVQKTNSGVVAAKFHMAGSYFSPCCFSPDGRLVATATGYNICIWDITGPHPHPVETFIGHTNSITSLTFSSPFTLISASEDKSLKFWWIGTSASTKSIALKEKNGPIIPSGLDGVINTWGICKRPLGVPTGDFYEWVTQLTSSQLVFVWYKDREINILDVQKGELIEVISVPECILGDGLFEDILRESGDSVLGEPLDLRVSGDGSKVFCLYEKWIQGWDIWTGGYVGGGLSMCGERFLETYGSKVKVDSLLNQGWDFETPGTSPAMLPSNPSGWFHLSDTKYWEPNMSRVRDIYTGKVIFQLPKRYGEPVYIQWLGQYLLASFWSKEVLVLDFSHHIFPSIDS